MLSYKLCRLLVLILIRNVAATIRLFVGASVLLQFLPACGRRLPINLSVTPSFLSHGFKGVGGQKRIHIVEIMGKLCHETLLWC